MSVDQYGARLLGDVQEENLQDLLKALRTRLSPQPRGLLGFPPIDRLLELFRYHPPSSPTRQGDALTPSASDEHDYLVDNTNHETDTTSALRHSRPPTLISRPPVIHLTTPSSTIDTTPLINHLIALSLLPSSHSGKNAAVIQIDSSHHFSALSLASSIQGLVLTSQPSTAKPALDNLITTALSHLHILRPTSSTSLLAILSQLPGYMLSVSNPSRHRTLGLLVLNSADAFQHQDRLEAELFRLHYASSIQDPPLTPTSRTIAALRQLQEQFECTLLFTTVSSSRPTTTAAPAITAAITTTSAIATTATAATAGRGSTTPRKPSERPPYLVQEDTVINPWDMFATMTLHINDVAVPQFAPSMTIEECLHDRGQRQEAVRRGRVRVGVDLLAVEEGREVWPRGVRDVVRGMEGRGGFVMSRGAHGLQIE